LIKCSFIRWGEIAWGGGEGGGVKLPGVL